jgi:uncharacterized damage-inducible protein DinB
MGAAARDAHRVDAHAGKGESAVILSVKPPAPTHTTSPETLMTAQSSSTVVISPAQFLKHWQGHRGLTRRVIAAFPDDKLFTYSSGGMRPFSAFAAEFLGMGVPTLHGVITGEWKSYASPVATTKADILRHWDEATAEINRLWPTIPPQRFQETDTAFGQWKMPIYDLLLYIVDNEIHHRGQGYVYLRELGIEPPPFYERA